MNPPPCPARLRPRESAPRVARRGVLSTLLLFAYGLPAAAQPVSAWMTSEDGAALLAPFEPPAFQPVDGERGAGVLIRIDEATTYQSILGLGASFEHATAYNLSRLPPALREETITRIVDPDRGMGMNLMRLCIGTSDFVGEPWYSYDDVPPGRTDPDLDHFSIEKDRAYVLPVLKTALAKNPDLLFVASPWSPPAWMKTNGSMLAGKLKPEYYDAFARYLVKFIRAYEAEGVPVYAVTPQNEPDYPNPEYPTTHWTAEEQRRFVRDHLGPLFRREGIETKIWIWDHNWHLPEFPLTILRDPDAARYVDGTAFHLYEGDVAAQTQVRDAFPDKHIYFTEGSTFRTRGAVEIVDILRNWSRSYNAWVVMLDERRKPNNGPHHASQTPLELMDDGTVRYNFDYYMYGHFMKFIRRGAVRIDSGDSGRDLAHVAFRNPDGARVLVVVNAGEAEAPFTVRWNDRLLTQTLPPRSLATYRW